MLGGAIQEKSSNGVGSKISDMAFVSGKKWLETKDRAGTQAGGRWVCGRPKEEKEEDATKGCAPQGERREWGIEQRRGFE